MCSYRARLAACVQGIPTPEELGYCDSVSVQEIGSTKVTVFRQDKECPISTVVVRAATQNVLDDIERAIGMYYFPSLSPSLFPHFHY